MTANGPQRWDAAELGRFLTGPYALESLSPMEGSGVVILDLCRTTSLEAESWRGTLSELLPRLPCVTVAIEPAASGASQWREDARCSLALACDVVLPEADDLDAFLAGFSKTPIAALAFVQLLRSSSLLSVSAGLIAESFVYSTLQSGSEFKYWLNARARVDRSERCRAVDAGPACRLDRENQRLTITLCRPAKHNAFSREMRDSLCEGLAFAEADSSIDEIVMRGEGPSFCSGGDLDEFGSATDFAEAHVVRTLRSPAQSMARLARKINVEVHGACLGAGVELPAFADRVIASEEAFFQLPEIQMGLIPGAGGSVSLPRRIGRQRTAWLGLSGRRIDAQTALAWGLVDEICIGPRAVPNGSKKHE
ncbi:MAG: enoyl-CoA hydratase/isomerase family protein [Myxococcota bacterium]